MASFYVDEIQDWKKLPIRYVHFRFTDGADEIIFDNLEISSSVTIDPIFAANKKDNGTRKVVAYKLEGTFNIAENDLGNYLTEINGIEGLELSDIELVCGTSGLSTNDGLLLVKIGQTATGFTDTYNQFGAGFYQNFEFTGQDTLWQFNIEAVVSKDAITNASNSIFNAS